MLRCCRATQPALGLRLHATSILCASYPVTHARFYRAAPTSASSDATSSAYSPAANLPSNSSSLPASADAPPQTYFDYLDRMWNSKWFGTVDEHTAAASAATTHAAMGDPSWFAQAFTTCQGALGIEAGALIVCVGAATRLCTLAFSLYGERASERMRLALPELKKPQEDFNRVYYNDLASAMEVQVAASALKSHRRAVFRKYDTSNLRCVATLAMAPVVMTGLYQISALCENAALDVGSSSFLWCSALTLPDPFMILPMVTCAVTLLNFELSISKEIKTGWMKNIIWGARLGCLCIIPVFSTFRAGVCLYLVGMNVVGLLQPLLLRSAVFRRWFRFPSAEALAAVTPATARPPHAARSASFGHSSGSHHPAVQKVQALTLRDRATSLRDRIVATANPTKSSTSSVHTTSAPVQDVLQASMTVQFPYLSHLLNPQVEENEELFAKARSKQSKPDFSRKGPITSAGPSAQTPSSAGSRYARGTNPLMRETPMHRHDGAHALPAAASRASVHPAAPLLHSEPTGNLADGGTTAADAAASSAAPAARRTPKNKGSSFASSGWKSAQLSFDEDDFIPNYDDTKSSAKRK